MGLDTEIHQNVQGNHKQISNTGKLKHIAFRLFKVACTNALPYHRDTIPSPIACAGTKTRELALLANCIRRDACRTKSGNQAGRQDLADLEHAILQPGGNSNAENVFHHIKIGLPMHPMFNIDQVLLVSQQVKYEYRRQHSGYQGSQSGAGHSHLKPKNQQGVSANVDNIHHQRRVHGDFGIAHAAKKRRARIIDGDEPIGKGI